MMRSKALNDATLDVFTGIAHPVRRQILDSLTSGAHSVADLAAPFHISRPAVSQHLAILLKVGLVRKEKRGRENYYSLRPEGLRDVFFWASHFERFWEQKLDTLGRYLDENAERQQKDA